MRTVLGDKHPAANKASVKFPAPSGPTSICVVGLGYIGLPTAGILADRGFQVHGVDVRPEVVETINRGEIHIHEPQLDQLVSRVVGNGKLSASLAPRPAEVFFICVPTPINSAHLPDLTYVKQAARSIRPLVRPGNLVILESTSPPGTTENIVARQAVSEELTVGEDVFVAYCPERVLPGRILIEVIENDRIVGGVTSACTERAAQFFRSFIQGEVFSTTAVSAEIVKLAENSYRDVNIAFANELSMLADKFGVDPFEIVNLANRHPRVEILHPGPGVGGHCISVDPWFLVSAAPEATSLIRTARTVNNHRPHHVVDQIERFAQENHVSTIGCLGLAYKADVDDLRESPSLEIVRALRRRGSATVLACDPYLSASRFGEFPLHPLDEVLRESELLVLLTDHKQFVGISRELLSQKLLVDTRGRWRSMLHDPAALADPTCKTPVASRRAAA